MSSIIQGYNYDIFISYRQNDNKHDGWVTEFVNHLKAELESTIKEKISIYFDINPHDGLLETHDVDDSLKEKLKCLVFIPIISLTYCDSKSFAWEHEFIVFVEQASKDQFGLKVKLPNGNVASRVLPVRIHDLDSEDVNSFEGEIGGVMRTLDFVFKTTSGVNRPLKFREDNPSDNLNKTYYQDQINKVALSIKEIILGLKREPDPSTKLKAQIKESLEEEKKDDIRGNPISRSIFNKKSKKWSIFPLSILFCIIGAIVLLKIIESNRQANDITKLEKSIAVLPFKLLSDEPDKQYLADGMMEAITLHLSKIKDLRVIPRTSVEQYRGTTKTTRDIGQELDVSYLVEGSFQKFGQNVRLIVQLIKAREESHAWANEYNNKWSDVFSLQSEISQKIASELNAAISPEEKQLIEKIPTASLTAYDFYQRGREEHTKYWINNNKAALGKAEDLYHKALKHDSTFAQAYTGLAKVYWDKHYWEEYFSENFMDSILILCDIALSFDNQLSEAYDFRGTIYNEIGKQEQAIEEFDKAIKFNPNDWMAYSYKADLYYYNTDLVNSIKYYQKAASINRGPELPTLLGSIGITYFMAGFPEKAKYYHQEALKLEDDSLVYNNNCAFEEFWLKNFNKSIEFGLKGYAIDSTHANILLFLGYSYAFLGQYKESLKYCKKYVERLKASGTFTINEFGWIGYVYWENGYREEAESLFDQQIKYGNKTNELKRSWGKSLKTYYDLAGVYAFRGENDKAYMNLRIFNQIQRIPLLMATEIEIDPLFIKIRNEPEFQKIENDMESKYQAEHERVRKWLEEKGML